MRGRARKLGKAGMEEAGYKGRDTHKGLGEHLLQVREEDADRGVCMRCAR